MTHCIGIDLGTSTTCAAVVVHGKPRVIPGEGTSKVIPSYIHIRDDGRILLGDQAKSETIADPYNTIWATKRLLGRKFDEPGVQECIEKLPYRVAEAPNGEVLIQGRDKSFTPDWAASVLIKLAANQASKYLDSPVKQAVVTVPGSFGEPQRQALTNAAAKAGIEVLRLINEPTAAALAWGYHKRADQTIAIFDLGGGTFDVSVIKIGEGGYQILANKGDAWLGGEDFDHLLVDHVVTEFLKSWKINIYNDKMAHQRVKTSAENAKIELSDADAAKMYVPTICPDISKVADVNMEIFRKEFDAMISPLVNQAVETFNETVRESGLEMSMLDNVIMVGGMTRVPLVRKRIEKALGRPPNCEINPVEAVARGAAIIAAGMSGQKVALQPPESTKQADEYLSGDVDLQSMYTSVLTQEQEDAVQTPQVQGQSPAPVEVPAAAIAGPGPEAPPAQLLLEVFSSAVRPEDLAQAFAVARGAEGPSVDGGVMIGPAQPEAVRIKVFQDQNGADGRKLLGEFVIQGYQASPQDPPRICVYYKVDKKAPFAVNAPQPDPTDTGDQ